MSLNIIERLLPGWGVAYTPAGDGPFPAILLLHGSEGGWAGWSDRDAVLYAAHGFAAMPLRYSVGGSPWAAGDIKDVSLDRTVEAMTALRGAPFCNGRLGVFGCSRGGEHALLVTALMARDGGHLPDAVAVHAPADVVCGAFVGAACRDSGDAGWQAWDPAGRAWTWRGSSDALLPTTPIEIERFDGPLFISHGTVDTVWSVEMTRRLEVRLQAHGRTPELHYYEGQGHGLGDMNAANLNTSRLMDFFGRHLVR